MNLIILRVLSLFTYNKDGFINIVVKITVD